MAHLFVINVHDGCYFLVVYLLILVILLNISNISILLNHAKYLCCGQKLLLVNAVSFT